MGLSIRIPNAQDEGSLWMRVVLEFLIEGNTLSATIGDGRAIKLPLAGEITDLEPIYDGIFAYVKGYFANPVAYFNAEQTGKIGFFSALSSGSGTTRRGTEGPAPLCLPPQPSGMRGQPLPVPLSVRSAPALHDVPRFSPCQKRRLASRPFPKRPQDASELSETRMIAPFSPSRETGPVRLQLAAFFSSNVACWHFFGHGAMSDLRSAFGGRAEVEFRGRQGPLGPTPDSRT